MTEVREYLDAKGNSPYAKWFDHLNVTAAVKVATATHRIEQGNFSNVKGVGAGVYEYRIDFGPGYRIYFGKDGERLVPRSARMRTSPPQNHIGATINVGNGKRCKDGLD